MASVVLNAKTLLCAAMGLLLIVLIIFRHGFTVVWGERMHYFPGRHVVLPGIVLLLLGSIIVVGRILRR